MPVDKYTFATANTQFKRTDYINSENKIVTDSVGKEDEYWEVVLTETNRSTETQNSSYVSAATLLEATAMYESVAEWTMKGEAGFTRVIRGGYFDDQGSQLPVTIRLISDSYDAIIGCGFRPFLYIKK